MKGSGARTFNNLNRNNSLKSESAALLKTRKFEQSFTWPHGIPGSCLWTRQRESFSGRAGGGSPGRGGRRGRAGTWARSSTHPASWRTAPRSPSIGSARSSALQGKYDFSNRLHLVNYLYLKQNVVLSTVFVFHMNKNCPRRIDKIIMS